MHLGTFTPMQAELIVSACIGFFLPYVIAVVNHRKMSDKQRIVCAAFLSLVAACVQVGLCGEFVFTDVASAFLVIWPLSQTFYRSVALKLGVRALENGTSPEHLRDESDPPLPTSSVAEAVQALRKAETTIVPRKRGNS